MLSLSYKVACSFPPFLCPADAATVLGKRFALQVSWTFCLYIERRRYNNGTALVMHLEAHKPKKSHVRVASVPKHFSIDGREMHWIYTINIQLGSNWGFLVSLYISLSNVGDMTILKPPKKRALLPDSGFIFRSPNCGFTFGTEQTQCKGLNFPKQKLLNISHTSSSGVTQVPTQQPDVNRYHAT